MSAWTIELERVRRRHEVYLRERMQVAISDPQYLWWDWVFVEKFEKALAKYEDILTEKSRTTQYGCLVTMLGERPRMKFEHNGLLMYRFTYAMATILPLSSVDLIRHDCNNASCINPRHLMVGDHKENFDDLLAEKAYGTRWSLLKSRSTYN